jgi:hypothetical protein
MLDEEERIVGQDDRDEEMRCVDVKGKELRNRSWELEEREPCVGQ